MKSMLRIFGYTALLGSMLMFAGCGDDTPASPTVTKINQVSAATVNSDGKTVTTTADVYAFAFTDVGQIPGIIIPKNTVITAKDANGVTIPLSVPFNIAVSIPASGVSGMPQPKTTGFTISSTVGAVDVSIPGATSVHFTPYAKIVIPIPISSVENLKSSAVQMNKNDDKGWINIGNAVVLLNYSGKPYIAFHPVLGPILVGPGPTYPTNPDDVVPYDASGKPLPAGTTPVSSPLPPTVPPLAAVAVTTDLCWFAIGNTYTSATGSTGGTGTAGSNF